jgi:hypothetical protein
MKNSLRFLLFPFFVLLAALFHDAAAQSSFLREAQRVLPRLEENLDREKAPLSGIETTLTYLCRSGCEPSAPSGKVLVFVLRSPTPFLTRSGSPEIEVRYYRNETEDAVY